jgi:hypothetical protein
MFGDEHVKTAIEKSGSLGSGDGVSLRDHTLQRAHTNQYSNIPDP